MQSNKNKKQFLILAPLFVMAIIKTLHTSESNQNKSSTLKIDLELVKKSHHEVSRAQEQTLRNLQYIAVKNSIKLEEARKMLKKDRKNGFTS